MIRDRGRIKWTSMMLPEHVKLLRDMVKEDEYEPKKAIDEQQMEWMNEVVATAIGCDQFAMIIYYHQHHYKRTIGKISSFDEISQKLYFADCLEEVHSILISDIADIRLMNPGEYPFAAD